MDALTFFGIPCGGKPRPPYRMVMVVLLIAIIAFIFIQGPAVVELAEKNYFLFTLALSGMGLIIYLLHLLDLYALAKDRCLFLRHYLLPKSRVGALRRRKALLGAALGTVDWVEAERDGWVAVAVVGKGFPAKTLRAFFILPKEEAEKLRKEVGVKPIRLTPEKLLDGLRMQWLENPAGKLFSRLGL